MSIFFVLALFLLALPLVNAVQIAYLKTDWCNDASPCRTQYGNWTWASVYPTLMTWQAATTAYRTGGTGNPAIMNYSGAFPYSSATHIGYLTNNNLDADFGSVFLLNSTLSDVVILFNQSASNFNCGIYVNGTTSMCTFTNTGCSVSLAKMNAGENIYFRCAASGTGVYTGNVIANITGTIGSPPPPSINAYVSIIKPNGEISLSNSQLFNFSCYGSNSTYTINQYIDGVLNYTNTSYANNTQIVRTLTFGTYGYHNTTVNCTQAASDQKNANFTLYQYNVTFSAREWLINATISDGNYTGNGQTITNGVGGILMNAQLYNVTFSHSNYLNSTREFNITSATQQIFHDIYGGTLNISAKSYTGDSISNFTINITGTGYSAGKTTTNGMVQFNLTKGYNYTLLFDNSAYELKNMTVFFNQTLRNVNFTVYTTNSINFTWKDIETKAAIQNVSLELISDVFSSNYSTTNYTLYLDLLSPAGYLIRSRAAGYAISGYSFTLTNRTFSNLVIYMVSNTTSTQVTATVYDENYKILPGVDIKTLRYDVASNAYILQDIQSTNFMGQALLNIILNTEYYKFILEYPSGTVRETTTGSYITSTSLIFQINTGKETAASFKRIANINGNLYFNTITNNFGFTFTDTQNIATQGCIKLYKTTSSTETFLNTTCAAGTSGTILIGVTNVTGTSYTAKAYVYYGTVEEFFGSLVVAFEDKTLMGKEGLFWIFILTIIAMCIGAYNITIALILTPLPLLIGSAAYLIDFPISLGLLVATIFWIIAFLISRK